MEYFGTLTATQGASTKQVSLSWSLPVPGATQVIVQRSPFGSYAWTNLTTITNLATLTYLDTAPEVGQFSYRLAVTTTQGGVDNAGTTVYSNQVDVTTAGTVSVVLTATAAPETGQGSNGVSRVTLAWTIESGSINTDEIESEVQLSLNAGTVWRAIGHTNIFMADSFLHDLPTGLGSVSFRIAVLTPPGSVSKTQATNQLQTPITTYSNTVTLSI
jgi:hypothetical protein